MTNITVIKQDYLGNETWRYVGNLITRQHDEIEIEAFFDRDDTPVAGITLIRGDRFVETYYSDRWYNIFEIHDQGSGELKGWYCNIGYPAVITDNTIAYRDLALDLLVYPDGEKILLDEDEFSTLPLSHEVQSAARQALRELQQKFR
jgi:predicted RNA-binding protein associated with RNAse of E/G family